MPRPFIIRLLFILSPFLIGAQDLKESLNLNLEDGLIQSTVTYIEEDNLGRIWIATPNGLNFYNGFEIGKIEGIEQYCMSLYSADSNIFCVGTKGVYRINIYTFKLRKFDFEESEYYLYAFLENGIAIKNSNKKDSLLLGFDLEPREWATSRGEINFKPSSSSYKKDGFNLVSNVKGVFEIRGRDSLCIYPSYSQNLLAYSKNRVFAATHNGLLELKKVGNKLVSKVHFPKYRIESMFKDQERNLWIATSENGLMLLHRNLLASTFREFKDQENDPISCWTFQKWNQELYVNSNDGVKRLSSRQEDQLEMMSKGLPTISSYAGPKGVFLGTLNSGVFFYSGNELKQIFLSEKTTLNNVIIKIFPFKSKIVATTKRAMLFFDLKGNFLFQKPFPFDGPKTYLMNIRPYKKGFLASTTKGIYFLDSNLSRTAHPEEYQSVISMSTGKDKIWLAALGDGLLLREKGKTRALKIVEKHFHTIHELSDDELWMSSSTSVYKRTNSLNQRFGFRNGFPIKEYNQGGFYCDSLFYYAGVGGVFAFNPDSISHSDKEPKLLINYKNRVLNLEEALELEYDQSEILLNIERIKVLDQSNFTYRFEFNQKDIVLTKSGSLEISPPYGESVFGYYLKNKSNQLETFYKLRVNRNFPFWKKWWFLVLAFLVLLLCVLGLFSLVKFYKTKKLLQAQKEEHRLSQERLRISQELHDNIGARISHIISSLDMEMYQRGEDEKVKNIENINVFARETMSQLRETIWMVSDKSIFYSELLVRIEQYVEQINSLTQVQIHFSQEDIHDFELGPIQTINFYRIVQEAINNALKYAKSKTISIKAAGLGNPKLKICIQDDGKGFDLEKVKKGTGIKGMEKRASEARATINISSSPKGTKLVLQLD